MQLTENKRIRVAVALLLPIAACWIQWHLWSVIKPFVWFLFFPTVFFSSRIGGKIVGFVSTAISALLVVYVFIPPQLSFSVANPESLYSVVLFLVMGVLFSQAHENLEKANHQVAAALEDSRIANEKVTHLYEKTLRLDELKTQFFANVSHELRTPLTLILGPVNNMLNSTGLDNTFRHELEMVERNARMLYRQVNDLLDVAKLEAGGMTLSYVNTELSSVVRFVASHFENRAAEQGINFRVEAPEHLSAQVDTDKYRRILLNLLANAFKFTQAGGEIIVTLDVLEGSAVLQVRDNGPGISVDKHEMIFERFSQVDGSTERRYGGTGLGLAIVREFAVLHGGSATVSEAPGGGALFTVTLPLLASQGTVVADQDETDAEQFERQLPLDGPQRSEGRSTVVSGSAPLILVVEDNPDMNNYITTLLGRHYRVASAFDGEEGLVLAESLKPDLLITDMMMPRMNGERLVQALRCKPEMDALPIIMLSAKADDALRVHLLENGVQDYLIKPFSDAELLARVGAFLAERQRTDEELFRSEEEFRIMFMESSVGMAQVAPDTGRYIRVNPAFCRLVGYAEQDLLNMTLLDITHPDERARDRDRIRALNNGEIPNFQEDKRYLRADGAVVYGHVTVNLISDKNGKPLRTLAVTQDITDRVLSEQELKRRNDELERFNRASVGRELEMIRLKQRINNLSVQLGQEPPYNLAFVEKSGLDVGDCTP